MQSAEILLFSRAPCKDGAIQESDKASRCSLSVGGLTDFPRSAPCLSTRECRFIFDQVLEEEYLSLHGALAPEEMVVTLNGRAAVARLDWGFHRGRHRRRTGSKYMLRGGGGSGGVDLCVHFRKVLPDLDERLKRYDASRDPALSKRR